VQRFVSYQQCTRFRTSLDFDREYHYLERIKHSTSRKRRYQLRFFVTFDENNLVNFGPVTKMTLTFDLYMTLKVNKVRAVVKVHVRAKCHQACSRSAVHVVTEEKNNTVRRYRAAVKMRVRCSNHVSGCLYTVIKLKSCVPPGPNSAA